MITIGGWLKIAEDELSQAGVNNARLDALILMEQTTGRSREELLAHSEEPFRGSANKTFALLLDRRKQHEPMSHLLGKREFYGLDLIVTPKVLTPRVETERIAELAIKLAPPDSRLLDLGTGSGALAIAVARHRPDLTITASDISPEALAVAKLNTKKHKLNIKLVQSDLWQSLPGHWQTVVTNLPYLSQDAESELMPEAKREPAVALFGGSGDGLDLYRRMLTKLPNHLDAGGYLFTECDPWQQAALIEASRTVGLEPIEQDYFVTGFRLRT